MELGDQPGLIEIEQEGKRYVLAGGVWVDIPAALQDLGGGQYAYTNPTGTAVEPTFWRLALRLN